MKNMIHKLFIAVCFMALLSCAKQTQDRPLVFQPERIMAGRTVSISYDNSKTNLAGKDDISAVFYYCSNYAWQAVDVDLNNIGGLWQADVQVPDSAALVAFKFVSGQDEDISNGMAQYVQLTVDQDTINPPSSYMSWCLLRAPQFEDFSIPGYISDSAQIDTKQVFFFWINQELKIYPEQRKNIGYLAARAMKINGKAVGNDIIKEDVNLILSLDSANEATEMDLYHAIEMAQTYEPEGKWAEEIKALSLQKYPNGIVARDNEIRRIFYINDVAEKTEAMAAYVKRFPYAQWKNIDTYNSDMFLGKNFQSVIYTPIIKENDYSLVEEYLHEVPYLNLITSFWHMIQIPYRKNMLTADVVLPKAKLLMDEIFARTRTQKDMVYTEKEWYLGKIKNNKDALLDYAMILNETGNTDEAFAWMQKIEPYYDGSSSTFSDFYITLLDAKNQSKKVEEIILKGVAANTVSPEMLERFKSIYKEEHGSLKGFEEYYYKLRPQSAIKKQQEEIKASFINQDIDLFSYLTMQGDTFDMGSMKGKILILDFWATWCMPCKAAMPGMNMAYQKYKDDEGVKFYFISTMENTPNFKEQITKFINEKDYQFTVLLDMMNPETHKGDFAYSHYAKSIGFSGIPQKIIIDGNGKLRWRSTGYHGSPSALADEIGFIIEELKKESK